MTCSADDMKDFVVKLSVKGKSGHATGFFVAPGLVMTCTHFIKNLGESTVDVSYQGNKYEAVIHGLPKDTRVDIATLRCSTAIPNHSCAHFDLSITIDDCLRAYGYPKDYPEGCQETFIYDNLTGGDPPLLKFREGIVKPGLSGAPLWNERTQKICGVVKETRSESIDLGGGGVPAKFVFSEWQHLVESSKLVDLILDMRSIEQVGLLEKTITNQVKHISRHNKPSEQNDSSNIISIVEEWLGVVHPRFSYPDIDELSRVLSRMKRNQSNLSDEEISNLFRERESTKLEIMQSFAEQYYEGQNPSLKHCISLFLFLATSHESFREWASSYSNRALEDFDTHTRRILEDKLSNLYRLSS
jgi:hypothetical protein